MAYSIVQQVVAYSSFASSLTTASFGSANTSGNLIYVAVWRSTSAASITSLTDTLSNTYTSIGSATNSSGQIVDHYYAKNIAGGTNALTALCSTSGQIEILAEEISGLDTSSPLLGGNALGSDPGTGANAVVSGTVTTTQQPALIIGYAHDQGNAVNSAGTSPIAFTRLALGPTTNSFMEHARLTTTGTFQATSADTGFNKHVATVAIFLEGASAAPSVSSATTDGADVAAASISVPVGVSSAKTDGADVLASSVGPVVAASSAKTDGADVSAAAVGPVVAASSAKTDGADTAAAAVGPVAGASSATTDGADALSSSVANVNGVGVSSAAVDGPDVLSGAIDPVASASAAVIDGSDLLAANVDPVVAAASASTDGQDVASAQVAPLLANALSASMAEGADGLVSYVDTGAVSAGGYYGKKRYQIKVGNRVIEGPREVVEQIAADLVAKSEPVEVAEIIVPAKRNKPAIVVKTDIVPKAKAVAPEWDDEQDEEEIMALLLA